MTGVISFSSGSFNTSVGLSGSVNTSFGAGTGFPYNIPNFKDYAQTTTDNRPDFEKAYDIYVKNKEEGKTIDPKQMFIEASKIAYAISKLENNK